MTEPDQNTNLTTNALAFEKILEALRALQVAPRSHVDICQQGIYTSIQQSRDLIQEAENQALEIRKVASKVSRVTIQLAHEDQVRQRQRATDAAKALSDVTDKYRKIAVKDLNQLKKDAPSLFRRILTLITLMMCASALMIIIFFAFGALDEEKTKWYGIVYTGVGGAVAIVSMGVFLFQPPSPKRPRFTGAWLQENFLQFLSTAGIVLSLFGLYFINPAYSRAVIDAIKSFFGHVVNFF